MGVGLCSLCLYSILGVLSQVARSFDLGIGMWELGSSFLYISLSVIIEWQTEEKGVVFWGVNITGAEGKGRYIKDEREGGWVRRGVAWLWHS